MRRDTLADVFADLAVTRGEFLVYDDGYRIRTWTYADVGRAARASAARLARAGLRKGDRVLLWGENSPEWIAALWGAIIAGVVVVPVDYRSSLEFVRRIRRVVDAPVMMVGRDVAWIESHEANGSGTIDGAQVWRLADMDWREVAEPPPVELAGQDTAEILFTSGATAEPKGVVLTHRNILANIIPVERDLARFRAYFRPAAPLRFLNLLPLSHMFGQAMATFIPPMLAGTTIFMRSYNPADIIRLIHRRRVSVLVSVPKMLDVLREHVTRVAPSVSRRARPDVHWTRRWWQHRDVHRLFGLKFWSCVVGAAPLDPELEAFWSNLGFLVVQGYGLTETAPIVAFNHPFAAHGGSVGKPLDGLDVKIAQDGEILVRGDSVTSGYFNAPGATSAAFENGWLRTGDIGQLDDEGRLYVRGRKKELIVRPDGLNVFPDDVERVLNVIPGVRESAVVGVDDGTGERVTAVLVVEPGAVADDVIARANAILAEHQRVRTALVWTDGPLPRTEGTRKLKRVEIKAWARSGERTASAATSGDPLEDLLVRFAPGRSVGSATKIDDLGLSSLDRIELMIAIEQRFLTSVDEVAFSQARDLGDLRALVEQAPAPTDGARESVPFPSWNRSRVARVVRRIVLDVLVLPLTRWFARLTIEGVEHLTGVDGPVVFASNHQSHMDTAVVLAALPARWRYRVAPAMRKEFFAAHFFPANVGRRERWASSAFYYLAALCFNGFPLPQREVGARDTLRYIGELAAAGQSVLLFPEGERAETGSIKAFRGGVGMIGSRLGLPVVPVRLDGVDRVLHESWHMARRGPVRVRFGPQIALRGDDYAALARRVEAAVRSL
ncbi:MAG: AMP-binding protein [Acidobacteria bacterium]|nr:AMP-binding protein [Acidobacteriota bacterium]